MTHPWHLYLMAILYVLAGINHFRSPKFYERIIPPFFGNAKLLNQLSGAAEILLGILLLIPQTTSLAAWGVIALLIAIFPANIYMATNDRAGMNLPKWILYLRLPMQLVLLAWAFYYT